MSKSKDANGEDNNLELDNNAPAKDGQGADTQVKNAGDGNGDKKTKPDLNKKVGLVAFIQSSKPNRYVEAMLKKTKAMEVHTLAEWQNIINDLLKKKVS